MTVVAIIAVALVLVLVTVGTVVMVSDAVSGRNPFALLWLVCGGLGNAVELIGKLVGVLVELVANLTGND